MMCIYFSLLYLYCVLIYRKAVRHTALMTNFAVTTTSASLWSGCVTAKKIARWGKMRKTAREQVQSQYPLIYEQILASMCEFYFWAQVGVLMSRTCLAASESFRFYTLRWTLDGL